MLILCPLFRQNYFRVEFAESHTHTRLNWVGMGIGYWTPPGKYVDLEPMNGQETNPHP